MWDSHVHDEREYRRHVSTSYMTFLYVASYIPYIFGYVFDPMHGDSDGLIKELDEHDIIERRKVIIPYS
jgi:hypothetical protein